MHSDAYIGGRSDNNINASCMTILDVRTKQLDIFCRLTGFTSDFLCFIVVQLIRFFHGALQFLFNTQSHHQQNTNFLFMPFMIVLQMGQ